MKQLVQLPYAQFMQEYAAVATRFDLGMFSEDTQVLYVPAHVIIPNLVYVQSDADLCVIADEYAQISLISETEGSHVQGLIRLYAHKNASITYTSAHTGTGEQTIEIWLLGQGAHIGVYGVYGIGGTDTYRITTKQEHCVSGGASSVLIKGIVGGSAVSDYKGMITITQDAPQSNANQQAAALLLSSQARARSMPSLQVLTNDVRCKHGSAVGQLDAEQIFYAQARGLSQTQAEQLLMHGFLAQAITHIPADCAAGIIERITDHVSNI